jgi:dihydrofolate synthase/folylpolyglutamate synthase
MVERLLQLSSQKGMVLGLERVEALLARLGHPERAYRTVHVAGSNGKGSTSAFLASILSAEGRRVGLYTSPHLVSLTERVQVVLRGKATPVSEQELLRALLAVERAAPGFLDLTFFEVLTAAGLLALAEAGVEVAVIEAGLGARLDATRLVDAEVSVLTELSLEHSAILGSTLEAIAAEKAHVIRPGRPLVAADAPPGAMAVVEAAASAAGAPLYRIGRELSVRPGPLEGVFDLGLGEQRVLNDVRPSLLGPHQGRNAILAAKAALLFEPSISDAVLKGGLESTFWPGRMEVRRRSGRPPVLLDGAHNAQGAEALGRAIRVHHRTFLGPLHLVFGVLGDKDAGAMLEALLPLADSIVLTRPGTPRARAPDELYQLLPHAERDRATVVESVAEAFAAAERRATRRGGWVVVAGSLYVIGEVQELLDTAS